MTFFVSCVPRVYDGAVRPFALGVLVGLLTLSASGVSSLFVAEPCTEYEFTGGVEDDGKCPPTCVTCGCCAQAAEPVTIPIASVPDLRIADGRAPLAPVPSADPGDILHVPRSLPA